MRALALALTVVAAQASVSMIGSPAPAFTGTTHTGASLSLADYQGKGLVIWFYPKAGTGGWTAEGELFQELLPKYAELGYAVVGISTDDQAHNAQFAAEHGFEYPLVCDVDGHVVKLFGACKSRQIRPSHHGPRDACTSAARVTVVIDPHGQVVGYEPEFNARTGPAELLSKLTTLHAGL